MIALQKNMILSLEGSGIHSNVIVLPVTAKDLKKGINAPHTGFFGFGGLWRKGNGTKIHSYCKIYDLSLHPNLQVIRNHILGLSKKQLKQLAKQIASYERIIEENVSDETVREAKEKIMKMQNMDLSFDDMLALDEYVQEYLKK